MKALSLWQPHALAIGIGLKPYETRDWPTSYRGPIAIHAAKRPWDDVGEWHSDARRKLREYVAKNGPVLWSFGAVVCTADLVSCVRTSELRGRIPLEHEFWGDFSDGEYGKGRFAFRLENVRMLADPLYVRGMQGFFEVDLGAQERLADPVAQIGLFDTPAAAQGGLFDMAAATPTQVSEARPGAPTADPSPVVQDDKSKTLVAGSAESCAMSSLFAQACRDAEFHYRGSAVENGDMVFDYSPPNHPDVIFSLHLSDWDRTSAALLTKAYEAAAEEQAAMKSSCQFSGIRGQ